MKTATIDTTEIPRLPFLTRVYNVMAASPLIILIVNAALFGMFASLLIVIAVSVDRWQVYSYDEDTLTYLNSTTPNIVIMKPTSSEVFFRVTVTKNNKTKDYYLYPTYSGIWRLCDSLTDAERLMADKEASGLMNKQCFVFVNDYTEDPRFTIKSKRIARLQNSAASCYIVVLIDLITAGVVGLIGIFRKQVASCMVTGVLYCMAALFGVFGLSMFHTKNYYESFQCNTMEKIPEEVCSARHVSIEWAIPLAWCGVVFCALASVLWWVVARALRVIMAKTML